MITQRVLASSLLGLIFCGASVVHAATVSFSDAAVTANVGDIVSLDIVMDFTDDPTLGGGTDIFYNASILSFQSFDFSTTTLALDPSFSRVPDVLTNELEGMAFGSFAGLSGPGIVGTLTFQAIAAGDITLSMAETDNPLGGGSFTSATTFLPQAVSFGTADVAVIPIPAAVWLFGSGLLGLVGLATRKHRAA